MLSFDTLYKSANHINIIAGYIICFIQFNFYKIAAIKTIKFTRSLKLSSNEPVQYLDG